jgi:hypothetical protein
LPLTSLATAVIKSIPQRVGRDYVFGSRGIGFNKWHKDRIALDDGITDPWRLHDLRRSVATGLGDLDIPSEVIEAALNHQSGHKSGIAGVYDRSKRTKAVSRALNMWCDHVRSIVDGVEPKVVPIKQTA